MKSAKMVLLQGLFEVWIIYKNVKLKSFWVKPNKSTLHKSAIAILKNYICKYVLWQKQKWIYLFLLSIILSITWNTKVLFGWQNIKINMNSFITVEKNVNFNEFLNLQKFPPLSHTRLFVYMTKPVKVIQCHAPRGDDTPTKFLATFILFFISHRISIAIYDWETFTNQHNTLWIYSFLS